MALNDIRDLVGKGKSRKTEEGGSSTYYVQVENIYYMILEMIFTLQQDHHLYIPFVRRY